MSLESDKTPSLITYPQIDPELALAADSLSGEEVNRTNAPAYEHEILWYGIDAMTHLHFMRMAQEVAEGRMERDELMDTYRCKFEPRREGFIVDLTPLRESGMFIPKHRRNTEVVMFSRDYLNKLSGPTMDAPENLLALMYRKWKPEDLTKPRIVELGQKFSKDLWAVAALTFERALHSAPGQNPKTVDIGKRLVEYYWQIVEAEGDLESKKRRPWTVYKTDAGMEPDIKVVHMGPPDSVKKRIERKTRQRIEIYLKGEDDGKRYSCEIQGIHRGTRKQLVELFKDDPEIMSLD